MQNAYETWNTCAVHAVQNSMFYIILSIRIQYSYVSLKLQFVHSEKNAEIFRVLFLHNIFIKQDIVYIAAYLYCYNMCVWVCECEFESASVWVQVSVRVSEC